MSDLSDPRVFFAAERTLLAWNRTSLALMAFGFVVERFGLFVQLLFPASSAAAGNVSFWIGIAFVLLGVYASVAATVEYRRVLKTLRTEEFPSGYNVHAGPIINLVVAFLGTALAAYLFAAR